MSEDNHNGHQVDYKAKYEAAIKECINDPELKQLIRQDRVHAGTTYSTLVRKNDEKSDKKSTEYILASVVSRHCTSDYREQIELLKAVSSHFVLLKDFSYKGKAPYFSNEEEALLALASRHNGEPQAQEKNDAADALSSHIRETFVHNMIKTLRYDVSKKFFKNLR